MKKQFVTYDIALKLKELGFDEPCLLVYDSKEKVLFHCLSNNVKNDILIDCNIGLNPKEDIKAPLYQQAFRWFREKYKISGEISSDFYLEGKDNEWEYNIYQLGKEDDGYVGTINIFKTYEDAELECLKKLIEIVKNYER